MVFLLKIEAWTDLGSLQPKRSSEKEREREREREAMMITSPGAISSSEVQERIVYPHQARFKRG